MVMIELSKVSLGKHERGSQFVMPWGLTSGHHTTTISHLIVRQHHLLAQQAGQDVDLLVHRNHHQMLRQGERERVRWVRKRERRRGERERAEKSNE